MELTAAPVIHGTRESGQHPEVVAIYWMDPSPGSTTGALCSGTVIGPHAVLTAKHCVFQETTPPVAVPADWYYVIEGDDIMHGTGVHRVSDVRTTPGTDVNADVMNGADIAVLLLPDTLTPHITPRGYATTDPTPGEQVTVVGFGRTMTGAPLRTDSGIKYSGPMHVVQVAGPQLLASGTSWTCQGDSGGPLIDPSGNVAGITSFGFDSTCFNSHSVFTNVAAWTPLIANALTWAPPCVPHGNEICNSVDDDCDMLIDEGLTCDPLGHACTMNSDCTSGHCQMTHAGMFCTRSCFPDTMIDPCPGGFHCEVEGCGRGLCVTGAAGAGAPGATCAADTDCSSGYCAVLQGRHLCGQECWPAGGSGCGTGLDCNLVTATECGACVPIAQSMGPRPIGSACTTDVNCVSMHCAMPSGLCTQMCASGADCPSSYHCNGTFCVPGPLSMQGGACGTRGDCAASAPDCIDGQCSMACTAGSTTCGLGFVCDTTPTGNHCLRMGSSLGGPCTSSDDCRSGLCTSANTCTVLCDAIACPSGFDCVDTGGPHICIAHVAPPASCGCRAGSARAPLGILAGVAALLVSLRRRRALARARS